ncbi:hypothetical protein CHS0354_015285 [Potamilus streckersoni]|uniref:HMG box domain-containing protein n=1 Tax=Potamilus streckersoni TaxID=2493646 RepID=A0AAE0S0L9_9BIVA|nr:hypothetical protein CHS0354_015285 [Potamilus streckersoni]
MTYRTPGATNVNKSGNIKRPMNAFMVWARDYRAKLAASMPNATNSDISIRLGQLWSQMSSEEKKPFYQEADNIKRQHRRDYPDWVYKPSPTRKKEEVAPPTQHSVLWARYTQGKGLANAGETIPNPVQMSASSNIISGTESTIPWTSVSNSTMPNQMAYPPCSIKSSSDQIVDSTLSNTSEQQQIASANSPQVEDWNTVVQRQQVSPYTEAVSSNAAITQQNVSSNTALPKQVVDSSIVKQATVSISNDTTNSCTVAQQTSFLSVQSDISTTLITPVDSASRENAEKERNEPKLSTQHKSVGNDYGNYSDSSGTDLFSVCSESFKSLSTHGTSSWTSHVYTPERHCIPSKTITNHLSGSGSTSLSGFQSEESFISSNSYNDGVLKSVHKSDSFTQLINSSSTKQSAASTDDTSQGRSSARSGSLSSSYRCSSISSDNTFQQSSSSCNFTPNVSSSSNYSWDSSTNDVMDDSCGVLKSEKSRQSSSKSILSRETSSNLTLSSSFANSAQSTTTACSEQELSSSLLLTPSKTDRSMSSFTQSKTDQSSNVSIRIEESSSVSTNSGVSFIQMKTHSDPKQNFSTYGQYSSVGALKPFQQITTQEPVTDFDESGRNTHFDKSSSNGSLKRGKEYSLNITGQTKIKQNDIKTVTKVIRIGNTTRTISDPQTENSNLRRLLTSTNLPSDFKPPESSQYDNVTVVDRSLVCNKQPVHGTHQSQPKNSKATEETPTNVSQVRSTERKHSTSSKMPRRKNNKSDNTGNSSSKLRVVEYLLEKEISKLHKKLQKHLFNEFSCFNFYGNGRNFSVLVPEHSTQNAID